MKYIKEIIIIALMICFGKYSSFAQSFINNENNYQVVIATAGLNMRQAPSLNAPVIKLLGYGEEVRILNEDSPEKKLSIKLKGKATLNGHWQKVSHRGIDAYVFSSFLAKVDYDDFPTDLIHEDFALLFETCSTKENFQFRRDFTYTGIYKTVSGKYRSKQLNPTYYKQENEGQSHVCLATDELEENILFIVGSRKLAISTYLGKINTSNEHKLFDERKNINKDIYYNDENGTLIYCYDNMEFKLNHKDYRPTKIFWKGDLDNDGIEDLIIQHGQMSGKMVLYLSAVAEKGELLKQVAAYSFEEKDLVM